jgi:hypothetical protein
MAMMIVAACGAGVASPGVLNDTFNGPDGLIASEFRPSSTAAIWLMTSGTLFRSNNEGWSGSPDDGAGPGKTDSAVFRMVSVQRDFTDVDMRLRLRLDRLVETDRTPRQDFDGAHIWVRYVSDRELYAVSVDRRDGTMIIKKKCPGGTENGGTYFNLSASVPNVPIPLLQWQNVTVSVRDQADGSVAILADRDGHKIYAVDKGIGCSPLRGSGGVGIRGDNAELRFDNIEVAPSDSNLTIISR